MRYHRGPEIQRGTGIGSVFAAIARTVTPFLRMIGVVGKRAITSSAGKAVVDAAKQSAIHAGISLAADTLKGKNPKASAKRRLDTARNEISAALSKTIRKSSGSAPPPKKKKKQAKRITKYRPASTPRRRARTEMEDQDDLFDELT